MLMMFFAFVIGAAVAVGAAWYGLNRIMREIH